MFLDEIGELPLPSQVEAAARARGRGGPRGSAAQRRDRVDVRFVAATNRDLEAEVAAGTLPRGPVLPPRGVAVDGAAAARAARRHPLLAAAFLERAHRRRARRDALRALASVRWPGNVRELRNVIERAVLLAGGAPVRPPTSSGTSVLPPDPKGTADATNGEAKQIKAALARCNGNQTAAAKLLGISRRTLVYKLSAFELPRPRRPIKA